MQEKKKNIQSLLAFILINNYVFFMFQTRSHPVSKSQRKKERDLSPNYRSSIH